MSRLHRIACIVLAGISTTAVADTLPKSGSFEMHTAFKGSGEAHQVTPSRFYRAGTWYGVTYRNSGSGIFHAGPVLCSGHIALVDGAGPSSGVCTFGDGPDQVHGEFTGKVAPNVPYEGRGQFSAGTGRYAGISGGWTFRCVPVNMAAGQWTCDQRVEYRLP
jgi:hypothetical protein